MTDLTRLSALGPSVLSSLSCLNSEHDTGPPVAAHMRENERGAEPEGEPPGDEETPDPEEENAEDAENGNPEDVELEIRDEDQGRSVQSQQ